MNLMDLFIKVGVKDEASASIKKLSSSVGKGLATAAKVGVAAMGAAATAVGVLAKKAIEAYGEYEQLVGGAQKIFDGMDYSKIADDANNAWRTMNLSAAEYLSMINSVGATFKATMGDEKGYQTAVLGMQAIADYASGTGRSVDELSQKFSLITRSTQSYQSIADQFSGILPATSADFLEQAKAAGFLAEKYTQLTEVPIAEYQEAVSLMLQKGVDDLNLTNNTMNETMGTITGSLAGLKATWQNLITGLGDPEADLGKLIDNVVTMGVAAFENILPVAERVLGGLGDAVTKIAPVLIERLPGLLQELLPAAADALEGLVNSLAEALPEILTVLVEQIPVILPALLNSVKTLITAVATAIPEMLSVIWNQIDTALSQSSFGKNWEKIKTAGSDAAQKIVEAWEKLKTALKPVTEAIGNIVEKIKEYFTSGEAAEDGTNFLVTAIDALSSAISYVITYIADWIDGFSEIYNWISEKLQPVFEKMSPAVEGVGSAFQSAWESITATFNSEWFQGFVDDLGTIFSAVYDLLTLHFSDAWQKIKEVFAPWGEFFTGLWDKISTTFSELGTKLGDAIGGSVKSGVNAVLGWIESTINDAVNLINSVIDMINNIPGVSIGQLDHVAFDRLAIGRDFVPYDNYPALLHRGEAVLTAREADEWRRGEGHGRQIVNNFTFNGVSQSDLDYIVAYVNRGLG